MIDEHAIIYALRRYKVRPRWEVPFSERCKANAQYAVFDGPNMVTNLTSYGEAHADREKIIARDILKEAA